MNSENLFQIEIPRRAKNCGHGNEILTPGMEYYSVLVAEDDKKYIRFDFCLKCWEGFGKNKFTSNKTSWKAKVPSKKEFQDLSIKSRDEKAFYLLKKALQNGSTEWAETFVLALYLARRRILYLRKEIVQEDGSILCVYEDPTTEEMFAIQRKSLLGLNIEEIQTKIAEKLNLDFDTEKSTET